MDKHRNFLSSIRHTYAGPWPSALCSIVFLVAFSHTLNVLLFDVGWLNWRSLLIQVSFALILVAIGVAVKYRWYKTR